MLSGMSKKKKTVNNWSAILLDTSLISYITWSTCVKHFKLKVPHYNVGHRRRESGRIKSLDIPKALSLEVRGPTP